MIKYNIQLLFIYLRAILNIAKVVNSLECAGYIMLKYSDDEKYNRERRLTEETLLKIGAWKKVKII